MREKWKKGKGENVKGATLKPWQTHSSVLAHGCPKYATYERIHPFYSFAHKERMAVGERFYKNLHFAAENRTRLKKYYVLHKLQIIAMNDLEKYFRNNDKKLIHK